MEARRMEAAMYECVGSKCMELQVEWDVKFFSERSITRLSEKLKGEKEGNTKKLVHLLVDRILDPLKDKESWLEFGLEGDGRAYFSYIDRFMSPMPTELKELTSYNCAFLESKIIIVGGKSRKKVPRPGTGSNQVFLYDTVLKVWKTHRMNVRRCHPSVVAVDNKIFVFGGNTEEDPSYQWGEYFDFGTNSWKCFPESPPTSILRFSSLDLLAVCQKQHMVLFYTPSELIVSFDYNNWKWDTYEQHMTIIPDRDWNLNVVVLDDFLFWNDCTNIYAHDLYGRITLPVCTLPTLPFRPSPHSKFSDVALICSYVGSFLVHIGKCTLCLLGMTNDHRIWYITFLIKINRSCEAKTIHLVAERTGFLGTSAISIHLALENSSK